MSGHTPYDEDILLWSEQQAEVIRRFGRAPREFSNELDIENVAEEIESVGRSELAAVASHVRLILIHLIKLLVEPNAPAARHWRGELVAFHAEIASRYTPSMRQRLNLDALWHSAREQLMLSYDGEEQKLVANLPAHCPITLDELLGPRIDIFSLIEHLAQAGQTPP